MSFLIFFNQNKPQNIEHTVKFSIDEHASVQIDGITIANNHEVKVKYGNRFEATYTVEDGYNINVSGASVSGNKIIIESVTSDVIINVGTEAITHTVTVNIDPHVTATYQGSQITGVFITQIQHNKSFTMTAIADELYTLHVDGASIFNNEITVTSIKNDVVITLTTTAPKTVKITTDEYTWVMQNGSTIVDIETTKEFLIPHGGSFVADIARRANTTPVDTYGNSINIQNITENVDITLGSRIIYNGVTIVTDSYTQVSQNGKIIVGKNTTEGFEIENGLPFEASIIRDEGYEAADNSPYVDYSTDKIYIPAVNENITIHLSSNRKKAILRVKLDNNVTLTYNGIPHTGTEVVFDVNLGESFSAPLSYNNGWEFNSFTSDDNRVTVENNILIVPAVDKTINVEITSKQSTVYHQVNFPVGDHYKIIYNNDPSLTYAMIENGKTFTANVNIDEGYEVKGFSGTGVTYNADNNTVTIASVTTGTTILLTVEQKEQPTPDPEIPTYTITYNITGDNNLVNLVSTNNSTTSYKEGDTVNIELTCPVGYELTSSGGLTLVGSSKPSADSNITIDRINKLSYSGVPTPQNYEITVNIKACEFNITYDVSNACCNGVNWISFTNQPSKYTYGTKTINITGNTEQWFKVNANPVWTGAGSGYASVSVDSEGSKTGKSPFTVSLTSTAAHLDGPIGDINIELSCVALDFSVYWNISNPGAKASINGVWDDAVQETGDIYNKKSYQCSGEANLLSVFLKEGYKLDETCFRDVSSNEILGDATIKLHTIIGDYDDYSNGAFNDAAREGYTSVWPVDGNIVRDFKIAINPIERERYNINRNNEEYTITVNKKSWDNTPSEETGSLVEYVEYNGRAYGHNEGQYEIIVSANNHRAFNKCLLTIGGVEQSPTSSVSDTISGFERVVKYVYNIKVTGEINLDVETFFAESQPILLNVVKRFSDNSNGLNVDIDKITFLTSEEDNLVDPHMSVKLECEGWHIDNWESQSGNSFGLVKTSSDDCMLYTGNFSSDFTEANGINYVGFTIPRLSPESYTCKFKVRCNNDDDWSNETDLLPSGDGNDRLLIKAPYEMNIDPETFKMEIEMTIYDVESARNLNRLEIQNCNPEKLNVNNNITVWENGEITYYNKMIISISPIYGHESGEDYNIVLTDADNNNVDLGSIGAGGVSSTTIEIPGSYEVFTDGDMTLTITRI